MKDASWPACALERAQAADLEGIAALERVSFTHPWTIHQLRGAILADAPCVVLVLRTPEPGEQGLVAYCIFQLAGDELDIHTLAVAPRWRRRGIGRWMLKSTLDVGAARGAEAAFLEVRQSNWAAFELYRSLGFEVISSRAGYYDRPREDAFVLRKTGLWRRS